MKGDIALEEYKSNSHRSKNRPPDSDKKVEKIISGTAKAKKKMTFKSLPMCLYLRM